jgi:hypothetical protein
MFIEHPIINTPSDNSTVWRYLDFTKFISLLDRSALFFCRADKFEDQFEGRYSIANDNNRVQWLEKENQYTAEHLSQHGYKLQPKEQIEQNAKDLSFVYDKLRSLSLINCWILSEYENAAMWKIFGNMHNGVAIKTTCSNLKSAIQIVEEDIYIGKVEYVDMENDIIPEGNTLSPFFHKWKYYSYEQEIRLFTEIKPERGWDYDWSMEEVEVGKYVNVDINLLIGEVYVAPYCEKWFFELVKSSLRKYSLEKKVVKSRLGEDPKKI